MNYRLLSYTIITCSILVISSCKPDNPVNSKNLPNTNTAPVTETIKSNHSSKRETIRKQHNLITKVKFKLANGSEAFSLKPKENGAKLESATGQEIARLTIDKSGKIKIKDSSDRPLGYVVFQANSWKLKNAKQTKELYILRQQADGDFKLETGDNKQIYRLKQRNYGWEIETPQKQSLYKIKTKNKQIFLEDQDEEIVFKTKSNFSLLAVACFGFDILTQEQQSALAYAVNLRGK